MATLQKLSWHGVCIATSKQASLIITVLAATMNSSSHLACRLVDVLEMVVEKYTHMINNKIDMGQKVCYCGERQHFILLSRKNSEDECSLIVDKHLIILIQT